MQNTIYFADLQYFRFNNTKKKHQNFPEGSIMARLVDFAALVLEFRRTGKGNHRHLLSDVIILMVQARASGRVGRADIIEFGRHHLKKFRNMGMLKNGVSSEATLCRVECGIDDTGMASEMTRFTGYFHAKFSKLSGEPEIILR